MSIDKQIPPSILGTYIQKKISQETHQILEEEEEESDNETPLPSQPLRVATQISHAPDVSKKSSISVTTKFIAVHIVGESHHAF